MLPLKLLDTETFLLRFSLMSNLPTVFHLAHLRRRER
jgi:hypothetical protein